MPLPGEAEIIEGTPSETTKITSNMADAQCLRTLMGTIVRAMQPPLSAEKIADSWKNHLPRTTIKRLI
eukprot:6478320-Amphidinium_carterae.1